MKEQQISHAEYQDLDERLERLEQDERVDGLVRELQSPLTYRTLTIRVNALMRLERLRAQAAARPIAMLIEDSNHRVRAHAIVALGRIGQQDKSISERLLAIVDTSDDEEMRTHATAALGALGEMALVPRLSSLLSSGSRFVRDAAVFAALMLGGSDAEAAIAPYTRGWRGRRRRRRIQGAVEKFKRKWRSGSR